MVKHYWVFGWRTLCLVGLLFAFFGLSTHLNIEFRAVSSTCDSFFSPCSSDLQIMVQPPQKNSGVGLKNKKLSLEPDYFRENVALVGSSRSIISDVHILPICVFQRSTPQANLLLDTPPPSFV